MRSCFAFCSSVALAAAASAQTTERVDVSSSGGEVRDALNLALPSISADGRYVSFGSFAAGLVPDDSNGASDAFVRDRLAGTTTRVSVTSAGFQLDGNSGVVTSLSADGRFVAFDSNAADLVLADANQTTDVFVRDLLAGSTTCASVDANGFLGNGTSQHPSLSADGAHVAFVSSATNLSPTTRGVDQIVVRDLVARRTVCVSLSNLGVAGSASSSNPSISADGRFVVFSSYARNLLFVPLPSTSSAPHVYVRDRDVDGNGVYDEVGGASIELVDVTDAGTVSTLGAGQPAISASGRFVAFSSGDHELVQPDVNIWADVFIRDLQARTTVFVTQRADGTPSHGGASTAPSVSADGRFVGFDSGATNLVLGDTNRLADVFVWDRETRAIERASVGVNGEQSNDTSERVALSGDGRVAVFASRASNLVAGDANSAVDFFVRTPDVIGPLGVVPAVGSEAGGDVVRIEGVGFVPGGTVVWIGSVGAEVLDATPTQVTVRTPPGAGVADVTAAFGIALRTLRAGYRYVPPDLAARYGTVNVGRGERENVLLANGVAGDAITREVAVAVATPIVAVVVSPSSRSSARFALWGWARVPGAATLSAPPFGVGNLVFPPPFLGGSPPVVWNNVGRARRLGTPTLPSRPAPSVLFRSAGATTPIVLTLQGVIEDDGSASATGWSTTNAVVLRIAR